MKIIDFDSLNEKYELEKFQTEENKCVIEIHDNVSEEEIKQAISSGIKIKVKSVYVENGVTYIKSDDKLDIYCSDKVMFNLLYEVNVEGNVLTKNMVYDVSANGNISLVGAKFFSVDCRCNELTLSKYNIKVNGDDNSSQGMTPKCKRVNIEDSDIEILNWFIEDNAIEAEELVVRNCNIHGGACIGLANNLLNCEHIKKIVIEGCSIKDIDISNILYNSENTEVVLINNEFDRIYSIKYNERGEEMFDGGDAVEYTVIDSDRNVLCKSEYFEKALKIGKVRKNSKVNFKVKKLTLEDNRFDSKRTKKLIKSCSQEEK